MSITHITSLTQLKSILTKSKDKLSVIDFHATWCGPCHAIAPTFEALSKKYANVNFLKCDVDAAQEVAKEYSVSAMPTFIFLKGSTKVDQMKGANKSALESTISKHASASSGTTAFNGRGQTLGGAPAPPDIAGTANQQLNHLGEYWNKLDPQLRVFVGLIGLYAAFYFLGG
ncbi:thioredoxin-like protein [Panaeolus papilionaceus]|nr:thioredoxin-like protein [Panaeolus papilionaceus]